MKLPEDKKPKSSGPSKVQFNEGNKGPYRRDNRIEKERRLYVIGVGARKMPCKHPREAVSTIPCFRLAIFSWKFPVSIQAPLAAAGLLDLVPLAG